MILDGKQRSKMFEIVYIPRIHDETVVARFKTRSEAEAYMETIKEKSPKAYPHHYIQESGYSEEHIKQMMDPRHNQWGVRGEPLSIKRNLN
tara:strand:+ start:300 stop:572 length:273 start_codon:yes stop_codon:yes gene_type:complete